MKALIRKLPEEGGVGWGSVTGLDELREVANFAHSSQLAGGVRDRTRKPLPPTHVEGFCVIPSLPAVRNLSSKPSSSGDQPCAGNGKPRCQQAFMSHLRHFLGMPSCTLTGSESSEIAKALCKTLVMIQIHWVAKDNAVKLNVGQVS